jgi:hypothetical protein
MKPVNWMYVGAVLLILIAAGGICLGGFILLGASGGAQGVTGIGNAGVCIGAIALIGGIVLSILAINKTKQDTAQNVTLKVDLPGETKMSQVTCKNCGGALKPENIKMVAGAPMVECPFCGTTYQLTEEPKW